ncbi:ricin B-like lectin [Crucibulum laeve]|uniref:Ricin B-like lectin n=1 Tax=Crucibulum laeve TaxID=68775 RepID=A0A5C3M1H9_9AGAR|nr:ricin B-like lectin [Crucibulum laeve]
MTELVQSGLTFRITNAKSGTVVDLSGTDRQSVTGWPSHGGDNQKWTVNWTGSGWTLRNVWSGLYLGLNGSPADGTRIVGVTTPVEWHIWHDTVNNSTYRIFVPNTHFNLDLYAQGNASPGNPITLWYTWNGVHQTWKFDRGTYSLRFCGPYLRSSDARTNELLHSLKVNST